MMMQQIQNMSRRGFLRLGALGALVASPFRRLAGGGDAGGGSGANGLTGYADFKYAFTGGWTVGSPGGFRVTAQFASPGDNGKSVRLAVSLNGGTMSPATTFGPVTIDGDGRATFVVTGLTQALTQYTCQMKHPTLPTLFAEKFNGWTGPANNEAGYAFDIVLGSCLANAGFVDQFGSQKALEDAANLNAPLFLHLGDWGYWGQKIKATDPYTYDLDHYTETLNSPSFSHLRRLVNRSNIEACISDHELHSNGDIWDKHGSHPDDLPDAYHCGHSIRQMKAHRKLLPVAAWGDASPTPMQHRGYFLDLAPHVRLVVSDLRSPQRNESRDQDTDAKQMWGGTQEQWLYNIAFDVPLDTVILFVNETVWWRQADGDVTDDKPASYRNAQRLFMERLNGTGAYAGFTPIINRFIWLGGDRHYCGYVSKADAAVHGDPFPQFIGSGFLKNSLALHPQEDMTWRSPVRAEHAPDAWFPVSGYMKLRLEYKTNPTKQLSLTGIARIVPKTHREVSDGVLNGTETVTSATASFTNADLHQIITGAGIPDLLEGYAEDPDDGPTTIEVINSATSVELSQAPKVSATGVTFAITDAPGSWPAIADYPTPALGGASTVTIPL